MATTYKEGETGFLLRLPSKLLEEFGALAADNERSTAAELRVLIREALRSRVQAAADSTK